MNNRIYPCRVPNDGAKWRCKGCDQLFPHTAVLLVAPFRILCAGCYGAAQPQGA
jgi:hypothetical protein